MLLTWHRHLSFKFRKLGCSVPYSNTNHMIMHSIQGVKCIFILFVIVHSIHPHFIKNFLKVYSTSCAKQNHTRVFLKVFLWIPQWKHQCLMGSLLHWTRSKTNLLPEVRPTVTGSKTKLFLELRPNCSQTFSKTKYKIFVLDSSKLRGKDFPGVGSAL
jgi:hypothetical protein